MSVESADGCQEDGRPEMMNYRISQWMICGDNLHMMIVDLLQKQSSMLMSNLRHHALYNPRPRHHVAYVQVREVCLFGDIPPVHYAKNHQLGVKGN